MAEPIAIWGAVTGTVALGLRLFELFRDRPRLSVGTNFGLTEETPAFIEVEVANSGRQPTTIVQAGLVVAVEYEFELPGGTQTVQPKFVLSGRESSLVPPGEVVSFRHELLNWLKNVHADFPLRAFAIDSKKRAWWGGAAPMLRRLLQTGWEPPEDAPEELLEPAGLVEAVPVEPIWKVWKPKGQRKTLHAQTAPPSFTLPLGTGPEQDKP